MDPLQGTNSHGQKGIFPSNYVCGRLPLCVVRKFLSSIRWSWLNNMAVFSLLRSRVLILRRFALNNCSHVFLSHIYLSMYLSKEGRGSFLGAVNGDIR
jgi:hypothetical protein